MLSVNLYIEDRKVELFKDEKITLNQTVQNIADISKTFADFSQSFSLPASPNNNSIFQHYYNSDVDGTFNPNIRKLAKIELGGFNFKYGVIQLEDVKMKSGLPYSYSVRFYSATVNLSDRFGEDELNVLDFSAYNHAYTVSNVIQATYDENIGSGDVYYPLISSVRNYTAGTADVNDILTGTGRLYYHELKPALRLNRILDAIEVHYGITFQRTFFNRAVFDNLFMWMHRDAGLLNAKGSKVFADMSMGGSSINAVPGVSVIGGGLVISVTGSGKHVIIFRINPDMATDDVPYTLYIFKNGVECAVQNIDYGNGNVAYVYNKEAGTTDLFTFKVSASRALTFNKYFQVSRYNSAYTDGVITGTSNGGVQSITASIDFSLIVPKLKIKDFITSIIKMFNLVLVPINQTTFELIPLDEWYSRGKLYDITKYVDIKDVTVKKPKLFKKISFNHQKSGQVLNERFRENNGLELGYGDLQTTYDIDGTELKVESQFDNLMFERLQRRDTGELTDIQVGKSIDKQLSPYIGKPYIFYRCGYDFYEDPIQVDNSTAISYTWHTSTENDVIENQITNSVNFSSDVSTYTYSEVQRNLFSNFWSDYISDLYDSKRRNMIYKAYLPTGVLITMNLNDRLVIGDKVYIQNVTTPELTSGETTLDLLNWIGSPFQSVNDIIPLTADTTMYTADTTLLTADMTYIYVAQYSPIVNGVSVDSLVVSPARQFYDIKVSANVSYNVIKVDTGDGTSWVNISDDGIGNLKIEFLKFTSAISTPQFREMEINITIGADNFTVNLTQGR